MWVLVNQSRINAYSWEKLSQVVRLQSPWIQSVIHAFLMSCLHVAPERARDPYWPYKGGQGCKLFVPLIYFSDLLRSVSYFRWP